MDVLGNLHLRNDRLDQERQDLAQVYRPQREWIDARGLLIVIAHFCSGIGAGAWLWSVISTSSSAIVKSGVYTPLVAAKGVQPAQA